MDFLQISCKKNKTTEEIKTSRNTPYWFDLQLQKGGIDEIIPLNKMNSEMAGLLPLIGQ
jgi:hypothetical protein